MLLSHYNNLIALNNKVSELSEYHKINDVKEQVDNIRRSNKYTLIQFNSWVVDVGVSIRETMDRLIEEVEYVKEFNMSIQRITNKNLEDITGFHKDYRYIQNTRNV